MDITEKNRITNLKDAKDALIALQEKIDNRYADRSHEEKDVEYFDIMILLTKIIAFLDEEAESKAVLLKDVAPYVNQDLSSLQDRHAS